LLLFFSQPDTINSTGIEFTVSGGGHNRDEGQPFVPGRSGEDIFCPTAGAAAYRRSMLEAIKFKGGYFDREHFMYYEDMDLGWRARLAGWSALYVPRSVVLHRWHGSAERHGRPWLVVMAATNRIRMLLKNASLPYVLRTSPRSLRESVSVLRHEGPRGLLSLSRAVVQSLAARSSVSAMARRPRHAVERDWAP
jgi:GT2 family glycosyltransferase